MKIRISLRNAGRDGQSRLYAAFTLVELLVVIAVVAVLSSLGFSVFRTSAAKARTIQCLNQMRSLGVAIQSYSFDHQGFYPRSLHSAGAHRESGWVASVLPYLSGREVNSREILKNDMNAYCRCPEHDEVDEYTYSYALNVHFELDPQGDDYIGSPATWRRLAQIPHPNRTILLAETRPVRFGDHLMSHQWSSVTAARNALAHDRHQKKSNYLFADGHAETLGVSETFNSLENLNLWNPSLAF